MNEQENQTNSTETNEQDSERLTVEVPTEIDAGAPPVCTCPPGCCG